MPDAPLVALIGSALVVLGLMTILSAAAVETWRNRRDTLDVGLAALMALLPVAGIVSIIAAALGIPASAVGSAIVYGGLSVLSFAAATAYARAALRDPNPAQWAAFAVLVGIGVLLASLIWTQPGPLIGGNP